MPLLVNDTDPADQNWQKVQYCFKGKPSFSIQGVGPRNINAFGVVNPLGNKERGVQTCHYIHESASQGTIKRFWKEFDQPFQLIQKRTIHRFPGEAHTKSMQFSAELAYTSSIFKQTMDAGADMVGPFLWRNEVLPGGLVEVVNVNRINALTQMITDLTFSACVDCNEKMTQMRMVPAIFKSSFPSTLDAGAWVEPTHHLTAMIYYLLLQGLLDTTNVFNPDGTQRYNPRGMQLIHIRPEQQERWKMKLAMMWCLLMIFLSNCSIAKMERETLHHTMYIYSGTSDFYLSLLLYVMYIANIPGLKKPPDGPTADIESDDDGTDPTQKEPLSFEAFRYFYMTNFAFYLRRTNRLQKRGTEPFSNSLTTAIFYAAPGGASWEEAPMGLLLPKVTERDVHNQASNFIGRLHKSLINFTNRNFRTFCQQLHTTNNPIDNYFPSYTRVRDLEQQALALQSDTCGIQQFVNILTPAMYWYPFKHITMAQISAALKVTHSYYRPNGAAVIDHWARHAFAAVHALRSASSELTSIRRLASASPACGP